MRVPLFYETLFNKRYNMKKITRNYAITMFRTLGTMALGHMDEATLTATLDNFNKFRKVQEDFQKLAEELSKRLYEGKDEESRKQFFEVVGHFEAAKTAEEKEQHLAVMKNAYPEFYPLYEKQIKVLTMLLNKEIEVDITEVDKDDFIKGVMLGKKDAMAHEIVAVFHPLFKKEDKKEEKDDFSELDELLKD